MERNRYRTIAPGLAAVVIAMGAATASAAVDCPTFEANRISRFTESVEHAVARCLHRHPAAECVDAKTAARLDKNRVRTAAKMEKRCPSGTAESRLADAQSDAYCRLLAQCPPPGPTPTPGGGALGNMTVRVTGGSGARSSSDRRLTASLGWTGQVRDVQVFEGAGYTAQLSNCDGTSDTQCDFHADVDGTRFGAPAQMAGGGVTACLILDFVSDIDGTVDVATGDLTQSMRIQTNYYVGIAIEQGCPACVPADDDPQLGESGTCVGGPSDGSPCTVDGLGDPAYGAKRGTSNDCQPHPGALLAEQYNDITATTGQVTLATDGDSPGCRQPGFQHLKCACDTCNNLGPFAANGFAFGDICGANADCPASGGQPGICGGGRCASGSNAGEPCSAHSQCPGSVCYRPGAPTATNQCDDQVCTPVDGGGVCEGGPVDRRCSIETFRACGDDTDCPASGDTCGGTSFRACIPDPLELVGTPDPPVDNVAHPTLVGTFCMGPTAGAAVNYVAGLPGPVTFTWPTEATFSQ